MAMALPLLFPQNVHPHHQSSHPLVSHDCLEEYEEDDEFDASSNQNYFLSRIRSRSLHAPSSSHPEHIHTHQRVSEYLRNDYLPSSVWRDKGQDVTINPKSQVVKQQRQQIVSGLSWEHLGVTGKYTGQINDRMQPHGSGALIYKDGSADTSIWQNGIPVRSWSPVVRGKKQQQQQEQPQHQEQPLLSMNSTGSISSATSNQTYLPHLDLGAVGTSQDMIIDPDSQPIALEEMNSLRIHDFAFILRSDGRWTYAIIAERQENTIRFVVDNHGDTKTLSRKYWLTSIRLVNSEYR